MNDAPNIRTEGQVFHAQGTVQYQDPSGIEMGANWRILVGEKSALYQIEFPVRRFVIEKEDFPITQDQIYRRQTGFHGKENPTWQP